MILLHLLIGLYLINFANSQQHCTKVTAEQGKYSCSIKGANDIKQFSCVLTGHECEATLVSYQADSGQTEKTLKFDVKLTMKSYTKQKLKVTVNDKNIPTTPLIDNYDMEYAFYSTELPRIDVKLPYVTSSNGFTAHTNVEAYLSEESQAIGKADDQGDCQISITEFPKSKNGILYHQTVSLNLVLRSKICGEKCEKKINIPEEPGSSTLKSYSVSHTFTCEDPIVSTIGHDQFKREITFTVNANYKFKKVEITVASGSVIVSTTSQSTIELSSSATFTQQNFKYSITDASSTTKEYTVGYKITQEGNKYPKTISKSYEYQLKPKETSSIFCKQKGDANHEFKVNKYLCDIFSNVVTNSSKTITLLVDKPYTISHNDLTLTKIDGVMTKTNHEVTVIAPNDVKCNVSSNIKLYFTEKKNEIPFNVTHYPNCKEPNITCATHDLEQRSIQCGFNIEFTYNKIKLTSSNVGVKLDKNEIVFSASIQESFTETINYQVIDLRKETSNYFKIVFIVLQQPNDPAFEISLPFEYVVKQEDLPHIKCDINTNIKLKNYSSVGYSCEAASPNWKLTLSVDDENFDILPTEVQGFSVEQIYKHNFDVVLTPKIIKCNEKKDVKISFVENGNSHDFTVSHLTTCPEPVINCDSHDFKLRTIACKIDIIFEFVQIKVESEDGKVILVGVAEINKIDPNNKNNALTLKYKVEDLKAENRDFKIKFTIKHASGDVAAVKSLEFTYTLKQDEIPKLICNEKPRVISQLFQQTKYACTIISHSNPEAIRTESAEYTVQSQNINSINQPKDGIYKIENHEISIAPLKVVCNKKQVVSLYFTDAGSKREFSVIHTTRCPEPEIYCSENDLKQRKIKCNLKIGFAIESVSLITSPNMIALNTNSMPKEENNALTNKEITITYNVKDIKRKDHSFSILFKVVQNGNDNAYSKTLYFNYLLRPTELPQIKCKEKSTPNPDFKQNDYLCTVISKEKQVLLKIDNSDYTLTPTQVDVNEYHEMYKQENKDVSIRINEIVCGKSQKIRVFYTDLEESTEYSDYVTHRTICPEPTVSSVSQINSKRKLEWTIKTKYKFTKVEFESNVKDVSVSPSEIIVECSVDECAQTVQISYEPMDWSFDQHMFHVINKITPNGSSPVSIMTSQHTFTLDGEELPFVTCTLDPNQKTTIFFEKDYICNIQSRQSSVFLSIKDTNYRIVKTHGTSTKSKHIYNWNKYRIVVKDILIKCNFDVVLEVKFSEYRQTYKSSIKYRTTCPKPVINCERHDDALRTIECKVTSKFPHTSVEIRKTGKVDLLNVENSSINNVHDEWISVHVVSYKLNDLLEGDHKFGLNVAVLQDTMEITNEPNSFKYTLAKEEKLQISCKHDESKDKVSFDTSRYSCYIVAKVKKITLALENKGYTLIYDKNIEGTQFENVLKWDVVKVLVQDTEIYCNQTKTIKLQAISKEENYETSIQHTTYCNQIYGDCIVYENIFSYVRCNYSSILNFQLKNYTCSEYMNCTTSFESNHVPSKVHEFILQIAPLTSEEMFEFDMNVTLSYSEHSFVTFHYQFDYNKEIEISHQANAAVKSEAESSLLFIATTFAIAVLLLLGYKKRDSYKPIIMIKTFKDYYNSL